MTQYIRLIGYPLKHSISPDFQQAALNYYKLDIRYELWEIKAEGLPSAIEGLKQPQSLGANVTVPYKEKIMDFLDEIDEQASLIGAVNTIVNRNGKLVGFNTDAYGFIQALRKDGRFDPNGKLVVLIGAGGAARAVSFALLQEDIASLAITNRTASRAKELIAALKHARGEKLRTAFVALPWGSPELKEAIKNCQLIVNCTTMGLRHSAQEGQSPLTSDSISSNALVYDLVYNPSETPLLRAASKAGARTLGGLPMLVYQGAAAFGLWTGKKAPIDIMLSTAKEAVGRLQ